MPALKKREGVRAKGQHSSASEDWGTDVHVVSLERQVLGDRIGVDPASSLKWNQIVGAERIITKAENGLVTPWFPGAPAPIDMVFTGSDDIASCRRIENATFWLRNTYGPCLGRGDTAHVNAPGNADGSNVATYWCAMAGYYTLGWLESGIWVGFSVEQTSRLQRVGAASHPLQHVTCIPDQRRRYQSAPGISGEQPGHASFITLLPRDRAQVRLFVQLFSNLGHVVVGDRWR